MRTEENKTIVRQEAARTFSTPWLGRKRVAFVPLFRTNAAPPDQIPPDWENVILRRVVYDPRREANGADRSLRAWLRAASSGLADIDPLVLPMQTIDRQVVEADDLEGELGGRLRDQGMDAAVLVMLGGRGAGTNKGFWSRVVMAESNGVWLMEMIHGLTGFKDLYHFNNDVDPPERAIDTFDEMSASSQTHPTAFTKNELGWLDASVIPLHAGASVDYELQHISLAQPPAVGRATAVRIGDSFPYVMVEARKMTDQFEAGMPSLSDGQERGIASEGVIAYRIQTRNPTVQEREGMKKPLYLMTLTALQPGQSAALDNGVTLTVTGARPDGFAIRIDKREPLEGLPIRAPVSAVARKPDQLDLWVTGNDGQIWSAFWNNTSGWSDWFTLGAPPGGFDAGAPVSAVARKPDQLDLWVTGNNGQVWSAFWDNTSGWSDWFTLGTPPGGLPSGAPIAAVARKPDQLDLWVTGNNGQVWSAFWDNTSGWSDWFTLGAPPGGFDAGAPVSAVARKPDQLDLWATGNNGQVWSAFWDNTSGWSDWFTLGTPPGGLPSGAPIAAVARKPDQLDLWVTGNNGQVWSAFWNNTSGWSDWFTLGAPPGGLPSGAPIAALGRLPEQLDLWVAGNNGQVWSAFWNNTSGWSDWFSIGAPTNEFAAGVPVSAVARKPDQLDLWATGNNGQIWSAFWNNIAPGWSDWFGL